MANDKGNETKLPKRPTHDTRDSSAHGEYQPSFPTERVDTASGLPPSTQDTLDQIHEQEFLAKSRADEEAKLAAYEKSKGKPN